MSLGGGRERKSLEARGLIEARSGSEMKQCRLGEGMVFDTFPSTVRRREDMLWPSRTLGSR